jgi:hypothetical protein
VPQSLSDRELLTQLLFETFDVPAACMISSPLLAMYGSGRSQGVVIDVGLHATRVSAVVEGRSRAWRTLFAFDESGRCAVQADAWSIRVCRSEV